MITQINDTGFSAYCSKCATTSTITFDSVQLGFCDGDLADANTIALPACSCGARTFLVQNFDETPAQYHGTPHDVQRRAVNTIAQKLRSMGRVCEECKGEVEAQGAPKDMLAKDAPTDKLPIRVPHRHRKA